MDTRSSRPTDAEIARLRSYAKMFRAWWNDGARRLAQRDQSECKEREDKKAA